MNADAVRKVAVSARAVAGRLNDYDESLDIDGDELRGLVRTLLRDADALDAALLEPTTRESSLPSTIPSQEQAAQERT